MADSAGVADARRCSYSSFPFVLTRTSCLLRPSHLSAAVRQISARSFPICSYASSSRLASETRTAHGGPSNPEPLSSTVWYSSASLKNRLNGLLGLVDVIDEVLPDHPGSPVLEVELAVVTGALRVRGKRDAEPLVEAAQPLLDDLAAAVLVRVLLVEKRKGGEQQHLHLLRQ